jgi:hypothetical protein
MQDEQAILHYIAARYNQSKIDHLSIYRYTK